MKVAKRGRPKGSTSEALAERRERIKGLAIANAPATVRQIWYCVGKTAALYSSVQGDLKLLREAGELPYEAIVDLTRETLVLPTWSNVPELIEKLEYVRDPWQDQESALQVWCEKQSLIGTLWPICAKYRIPLSPTRGHASITFLRELRLTVANALSPVRVCYIGDYDADGYCIRDNAEAAAEASGNCAEFTHLAVSRKQIDKLNLQTRAYTPRKGDKPWGDDVACDVEAIAPPKLRDMLERWIVDRVDPKAWQKSARIEARERRDLRRWIESTEGSG